VRVLGGLAEIMLTAGDTTQCRTYADELLDLAEANGLRENEAIARRWRGEALLTENHFEKAQAELSRAAEIAEDIGRVRLQLDTHTALAQLFTAQGQHESAQQHTDRAAAAKGMIANSLTSSGLDVSPSFT
jgi:tetratricopeptide (TPR) repeat protein